MYYTCSQSTAQIYTRIPEVITYSFIYVLVSSLKSVKFYFFKRYELYGWFVVKTLLQFLHVLWREGHTEWEKEGGWDRKGGRERVRERWWVDERRGGTQQNPVQHCAIYWRCYTVHWQQRYPLLVCSSGASAKQEDYATLYTSNQIRGLQHPIYFVYFPFYFTPVFFLLAQTGNMWGQVWVSVTGVLVIFSCRAESLEDCILEETLFDSSRHLVCRHCLGIRLIKGRASRMKVSWATVPGLLWERKKEKQREKIVGRMIHALK